MSSYNSPPRLTHLKRLTTVNGLIQHADHDTPDPSFGYSIDDNARALIVCLWYYRRFGEKAILNLADIYFGFLKKAERKVGSFHNFISFSDQALDEEGSEDSLARTAWALAETIALHPDKAVRNEARAMIDRAAIDRHRLHPHIRAKAYLLLSQVALSNEAEASEWAEELVTLFNNNAEEEWQWFEDNLRYANGILPYALARAGRLTNRSEFVEIASKSFLWLDAASRENGTPSPIGQDGWYYKGGVRALYDQQPLEAADMVLAAMALFEVTEEKKYYEAALDWMNWYEGNNTNSVSLINENTGGIYDALTPNGVNKNQGAESIVTYLMAYLALANAPK